MNGAKPPVSKPGVGLAMAIPPAEPLARQGIRCSRPPPSRSESGAEAGEVGCPRGRCDEGGKLPHVPPFVPDTPAGTGPGHQHHPGATRPQGCEHQLDLHACA